MNEQTVLQKLAEREIIMNVNGFVEYIRELAPYNDEVLDLFVSEPDKYEAVIESGYDLVQDDHGNWYYYERSEKKPFSKRIPDDANLLVQPDGTYSVWVDGADPAEDEPDSTGHTEQGAYNYIWDHENLGMYDSKEEAIDGCIDMERIDLSDHCAEVYEHYAVTRWFANKLAEVGETVREFAGYDIWCRTCTGQATWMDDCFKVIATKMEILPGMKYDWTKND